MKITATQLKQQTYLLDRAVKEDILVTKRDRPFVVIVDAKRYEELIRNDKISKQETNDLLKEFRKSRERVSKIDADANILKMEDEMYNDVL